MALLIDNDIVYKLCQLNLHNEAIPLLRKAYGGLFVLNTLEYKFIPPGSPKKRKRLERRHTPIVISRIKEFISNSNVEKFSAKVEDPVLLDILAESDDGLDQGEMQLLQGIINEPSSLMITGDKRFLRALSSNRKIDSHIEKIKRSFICFEQLIVFLINEEGFDYVKSKFSKSIQENIKIDATLKHCFEGQDFAIQERVLENLSTHINYIMQDDPGLLLFQYP